METLILPLSSRSILGKGTVKLGRENVKAGKFLLVEYLKHNLLSVIKICDQGYTLTFDSRKCKIRENNSGRLVATTIRRTNNIYILDMKKREKTEATQKDPKEEKVPKTKNKDEVLLSATCLGGGSPKEEGYLFPLSSGGEAIPFSIDVKGGEKLGSW
jgi:hypothetical protein